LTAKINQ